MTSATIKLFLQFGDGKSLRTAEVSNWSGKAVAAPRTELQHLLAREELAKAGLYILLGSDPETSVPRAYIGEAEVVRDRLRQHTRDKEFASPSAAAAVVHGGGANGLVQWRTEGGLTLKELDERA